MVGLVQTQIQPGPSGAPRATYLVAGGVWLKSWGCIRLAQRSSCAAEACGQHGSCHWLEEQSR